MFLVRSPRFRTEDRPVNRIGMEPKKAAIAEHDPLSLLVPE